MKAPGYPRGAAWRRVHGSVLRSRAARCATGRLPAARGGGGAAGAARRLPAGGRGIRGGRGAATATSHGGAHEHSRNGRHCQGLRKVHFRSPRSSSRSVLVIPSDSPPGFGKTYARTVSRYRTEEALFCVAASPSRCTRRAPYHRSRFNGRTKRIVNGRTANGHPPNMGSAHSPSLGARSAG